MATPGTHAGRRAGIVKRRMAGVTPGSLASPKEDAGSDDHRLTRFLFRFSEGHRRLFVLTLLMLAVEAIASVFKAYPIGYLVDYLRGNRPDLWFPGIASPRIRTTALLTAAIIGLAALDSLGDSRLYPARASAAAAGSRAGAGRAAYARGRCGRRGGGGGGGPGWGGGSRCAGPGPSPGWWGGGPGWSAPRPRSKDHVRTPVTT